MLMKGQQPNRESLLAWINQVSFAVNEMMKTLWHSSVRN